MPPPPLLLSDSPFPPSARAERHGYPLAMGIESQAVSEDGDGSWPPSGEIDSSEAFRLLYTRLHRQAQIEMRRQPAGHTLQATALVNEVYLKLFDEDPNAWRDRKHFLFTAARAMRQILIDSARRRNAAKRGGGVEHDPLGEIAVEYADRSMDLDALHRALEKLAGFDPLMTRAVELRFFAGCSMDEVAELLGIPRRTLDRRWSATRAWLYGEVR
jgi:RNA polymerase sigma-70 factor (ECF subfamily)